MSSVQIGSLSVQRLAADPLSQTQSSGFFPELSLHWKPHLTLLIGASAREPGKTPCSPTSISILKANSEEMVIFLALKNKITTLT